MDKQREKMGQQQQRDRERTRMESIQRKWTKREEADFFKIVSSYGIDYDRKKKSYDWTRFKTLAKLEKKTDELLSEYYKNFILMCKKQCGVKIDEDLYDPTVEQISEDKAKRTLERIELLSKIREDIIMHPQLDERMKLCQTSADLPDWWVPGKHDRDLLIGVAKHGLGRTDYHILNDPELSFQEILRKQCVTEPVDTKEAIKLESHEDLLKFDKNEILVKLEKGEGTLKIEKVALKKENDESKIEKMKSDTDQVEMTLIKTEKKSEEVEAENKDKEIVKEPIDDKPQDEIQEGKTLEENEEKKDILIDEEKMEVDETEKTNTVNETDNEIEKVTKPTENIEDDKEKEQNEEKVPEETEKQIEELSDNVVKETKPIDVAEKQKTTDLDKEMDVSKQAAELKAMFPDLEVIQPLSRLSQIDTFVLRDRQGSGALDFSETTVAQLFNNAVKWPKEYAIQVRLQHICYVVENNEWPVSKTFTAYAGGIGHELDMSIHETPNATPKRDTSTPMSVSEGSEVITITTDHCIPRLSSNKKRKRHIAIDVETERAKLHALLNSSHSSQLPNPLTKPGTSWDNDDSEDSRRSTPVTQNSLQPPPAHQNAPRVLSMPYDLKYHVPGKQVGTSTVIPGTSSTLTPIDLSSGLPKMNTPDIPKVTNQDLQNEVQDFSMPSKKQSASAAVGGKGKLDDMLNKLKKRNNCPVEEPVVGKEKKRRKLDEIVLGLSAAKEQSLFPEPSKKQTITPSVTVTPTSAPVSSSHMPTQKPFTITVTSVPSPAPSTSKSSSVPPIIPSLSSSSTKDSFSSFLAQAEQQNLLLKKQQQQQRKSYEAMIADINKVADFSSKVNSYSHEAKVNKWLAEQNSLVPDQPLSADYLSASRRRRPRVDPSLLDWKKLTGEENVPVIDRLTGKKITGIKAPQLKHLGQWLIENPMFDVDPKWAELVKERGNLSHDMQKGRLSSNSKKGPGRPPLLASPTGTNTPVSSAPNLATSMASSLPFPSLASSGLSGLNSNLLSSLSLGQFDPKTNPLLLPFGGMSNMSALNSMGGLGSLGNMNLFANLAGLGIPGLTGMDGSNLASESSSTGSAGGATSSNKNKSRKPQSESHSSNKVPVSSSASTIPTTSPFPFFFPNPSLLYTPLGLGGLNPFSLQPGMSSAYDSLAQQCGLLNGTLGVSSASPTPTSSRSGKSSSGNSSRATTTVTSVSGVASTSSSNSNKHPRSSSRDTGNAPLQQLLLPHDAHLLESISRVAGSFDGKRKESDKKDDKRKALESLGRSMLPSDYTSDKLKSSKRDFERNPTDLSKFMELPGSTKRRELDMKEALEQLSKTSAEFIARTLSSEERTSQKRPRESKETPENLSKEDFGEPLPATKKMKESPVIPPVSETPSIESGGVDIEALLTPSTVVKGPLVVETDDRPIGDMGSTEDLAHEEKPSQSSSVSPASKEDSSIDGGEGGSSKKSGSGGRRTRGKRKSGEMDNPDIPVVERKNLRSSAGRAAAAAAARAAAEQAAAKQLQHQLDLENSENKARDANSDS